MRKFFFIDDELGGGGDKELSPTITPPKNYKTTTPEQRQQWNDFLDYVGKQPNIDFNTPQTAANLFGAYKKVNPKFALTPDQLNSIQYEQYQLRKGDKFGNLDQNQLKYIRNGLSPDYVNKPIGEINGQLTPESTKLYYPQTKDFGTDIEGYYNNKTGKVGGGGANPTVPNPPNRIPLPDYNNPKSRLSYAQNWTKKYGPLMQGRGDTPLRVNEIPEGTDDDVLTAKEMSMKAANPLKLDPALLYASAMEEGMSGLYGSDKKLVDYSGDDKYPIDGFVNFGLDNFSDFYPELVKKGYLSEDFKDKFKKQQQTNELGQKVNSANFKTAEAALQAKAAVIRHTQDQTEDYAKKNGIQLSDKAKQFFTLINYNAGEGAMRKMLAEYNQNGYLRNDKFLEKRPSEKWKQPYENVIRRIQMAEGLKKEGLF